MQGVQSLLGMYPQHIMALLPTILYDGTSFFYLIYIYIYPLKKMTHVSIDVSNN